MNLLPLAFIVMCLSNFGYSQNIIEDSIFLDYLLNHEFVNENGDDKIEIAELKKIEVIWYDGEDLPDSLKIRSLKGIEYCDNLKLLYCEYNLIDSLDLRRNSKLEKVSCHHNSMEYLQISNLKNLEDIDCQFNKIQMLDCKGLKNLKTLNCRSNQLSELKLSESDSLGMLLCWDNKIDTLSISNSEQLSFVNANYNNLVKLEFCNKTKTALKGLDLANNQFKVFDTREYPNIEVIDLESNPKLTRIMTKPSVKVFANMGVEIIKIDK